MNNKKTSTKKSLAKSKQISDKKTPQKTSSVISKAKREAREKKLISDLKGVKKYIEVLTGLPKTLNQTTLLKGEISKNMKLTYVRFWRKISTGKMTPWEVQRLLTFMLENEK